MNSTQIILKIAEIAATDLPNIRYDTVEQLFVCHAELIADSPTIQTEAIAQQSSTQLRRLNAWEQAHIDYVFYWLNLYEPGENCSNLERVEGYLQAFHHLCDLSLWQQAYQVVCTAIDGEALHEKLETWGYYIEQIEIYQKLLNKIDDSIDCICLNGLGYAFHLLGRTRKSFQYHKEQLKRCRKTKNYEYECQAWKGLGLNYRYSDKTKAIRCHLKQLNCAESHQIVTQQLSAFLEISRVYGIWSDAKSGLQYIQKVFNLARLTGNQKLKFLATKQLLHYWSFLGQYHKIKRFLVNHEFKFIRDLETLSLHEQLCGYEIIGRSFGLINDYKKFIYYYDQCLQNWQKIKAQMVRSRYDCPTEHYILHNLGFFYCLKFKNPQVAVQYLEQAYAIGSKGTNYFFVAVTLAVLAHCYSKLGKIDVARERGEAALALAEQINDPVIRYYAMAGLASVAWHQGHYLRTFCLIGQGFWGAKVWQGTNTQMILRTLLGLMGEKLRWWR